MQHLDDIFFSLGFIVLDLGIYFKFGFATALIAAGIELIITAIIIGKSNESKKQSDQ